MVPTCIRKLSECLKAARAVAAALPAVLGPGPVVVHSLNTGCIPGIQVAAELSQPGAAPQAALLVLECGVPSLAWIPGAQAMIGCLSVDHSIMYVCYVIS